MTDGVGGITSTANPVQILGKDKNLTEAIRLAGQHKGSEIVVGYVDKSKPGGEHAPIQYAVIDVGPALTAGKGSKTAKTTFDPSTLNFGDGTQIVSAIVVTDQKDGKVDRNYLGDLKFLDGVDPSIQTDTVLALAEAACSRVGDPSKNKQIEGFNPARTNTDWVKMVHENRGTVLRQVSVTLDTLDTTIKSKENALATAIKEGRTDDAEALKKELTDLRGQRDELATYQGIIRVDLLTDPKGVDVVPGMQAKDGTPMHAGDWRNMSGAKKAINLLVEEKAVLQGKLQSTTDPEQKGRLERQIAALDDAIQGITFKTADSIRSQGLINRRMGALGTLGQAIDGARDKLEGMKVALKDAKFTNASAYGNQANTIRAELINTFKEQRNIFKAAGGAKEAIAFLDLQIRELETLPQGNIGALLDQIDKAQAGLLKQIQAHAAIIDRITPGEGQLLAKIGTGVDDFRKAYLTIQRAADLYESFADKLGDASGSQGFRLSQTVLNGLGDAMKWDPIKGGRSPFQTNQFIVGQYVETSKEIRAYVGSDTPDWYAVGAKACNQVGGEIAKLMTVETCLATFGLSDGTIANDLRAAKALLAIVDGDTLGQGGAVAMALGSDFIDALRSAVSKGSIGPLSKFADKLPGLSEAVSELRKGFVEGNVRIAQNVLTARKVFFEAEFAGEDGVAALKTYAKTHPNFDPEGYMVSAYTCIQQAKAKNESGDKAGADKLMLKANAFIAMQEQSTFLQTKNTFGNKSMRLVLDHAGSSSSLSLEKPDGSGTIKYQLVDNWTKLHVRMGMDYVSKDSYEKNAKTSTDGALYFKLTIKPDQRLEVEPGMNLKPEDTVKDDQGRLCVRQGVTVYMKLPENAPMGTAGRLFIEANKDGDIEKSMLVRPEAPPGPSYTYDANDGLVDLAGDMLESAWDFVSADVSEVFEGSDKDVKKKPESLSVNGGTTKTQSGATDKQPVTTGST
jgi:hypothetical protein